MEFKTKKYLMYVRQYSIITNNYELYVYECETTDIFHVIGMFYFCESCKIDRIDIADDIPQRREFWKEKNKDILKVPKRYLP